MSEAWRVEFLGQGSFASQGLLTLPRRNTVLAREPSMGEELETLSEIILDGAGNA